MDKMDSGFPVSPPQVPCILGMEVNVWSLCRNHQCLPWWEPPAPLFFGKKVFLFLGFGISWMSITWIVLCFLASQSKAARHQLPISDTVQLELSDNQIQTENKEQKSNHFQLLYNSLEAFYLPRQAFDQHQNCLLSVVLFVSTKPQTPSNWKIL